MLIAAMTVSAIGLLLWPSRAAGQRLARLLRPTVFPSGHPDDGEMARSTGPHRRFLTAFAVCVTVGCVLTVGMGATVGCGLLVAAVVLHRRARVRARTTVAVCGDLASLLRGVVTELRAGAHPVTAVENVAREAPRPLADRLRGLAASARFSGVPTAEPEVRAACGPGMEHVDRIFGRLATSWALSARHGIPLADVFDAVHRDMETTARSARQLDARLAGSRAGAAVLAFLPVAGLVLGEAMGAAPIPVLMGTSVGSVLFVVGAALLVAGVAWTSSMTGRVLQ